LSRGATKFWPPNRVAIFAYDVGVLAACLAIGLALIELQLPKFFVEHHIEVRSMWFGALGGIMISLKGIYEHAKGPDGWDDSFSLWHIGRPFSGAITGLMTVVLMEAANPGKSLTAPVVYAAAFVFGTQERRFFNFLYEVAKLVVQVPGDDKSAGPRLTEVQPGEGPPGTVFIIRGRGIEPSPTIKFGSAKIDHVTVASDGTSAAGVVPARPAGAEVVDVIVVNQSGTSMVLAEKFKYTD
jgi:hypothetical protein